MNLTDFYFNTVDIIYCFNKVVSFVDDDNISFQLDPNRFPCWSM